MDCPECNVSTPVWQSSGMSECYPHFYCDRCSNAIHWEHGKDHLLDKGSAEEALKIITSELPKCDCGGQFSPGQAPKCKCGYVFYFKADPIERLSEPNVLILSGSKFYPYNSAPYVLKIHDENIFNGKRIVKCDSCSNKYALPNNVNHVKARCPHCAISSLLSFHSYGYEAETDA